MFDPCGQHIVRGLEIHGRDHGDEITHLLGVQRRVAERKGSALADAQYVDPVDAMGLADVIDATIEIAVDIVVHGQ